MLLKSDLDFLIKQRDELNRQIQAIKTGPFAITDNFVVQYDTARQNVVLKCTPVRASEDTRPRILAVGSVGSDNQKAERVLADVVEYIAQLQSIEEHLRKALGE